MTFLNNVIFLMVLKLHRLNRYTFTVCVGDVSAIHVLYRRTKQPCFIINLIYGHLLAIVLIKKHVYAHLQHLRKYNVMFSLSSNVVKTRMHSLKGRINI